MLVFGRFSFSLGFSDAIGSVNSPKRFRTREAFRYVDSGVVRANHELFPGMSG